MKILIVDDHAAFRDTLKTHLGEVVPGASVAEFGGGAAARQQIIDAAAHSDVVLMDHRLEGVDGFALLQDVRQANPATPVIFLSSRGDETLVARAFRAGVADYLPKSQVTAASLSLAVNQSLRASPARGLQDRLVGAPVHARPQVVVKGYAISERLAHSAVSSVYLATDVRGGRPVALKIMTGLIGCQSGESLERFLREYETVSALQHRNIVRIFDFGFDPDQVYIAMEYLPGGTLRRLLAETPPTETRALEIVLQVLEALTVMHEVGITHRDLKPGNIMFHGDSTACLIDFGLAKHVLVEQALTIPGRMYGTPYYMSPEQGQGLGMDVRSDLYSIGVILYEMLTGSKPYIAGSPVALVFKHAHAPLPQLPAGLRRWQPLIDKLMAKRPSDRPATPAAARELVYLCKRL